MSVRKAACNCHARNKDNEVSWLRGSTTCH